MHLPVHVWVNNKHMIANSIFATRIVLDGSFVVESKRRIKMLWEIDKVNDLATTILIASFRLLVMMVYQKSNIK